MNFVERINMENSYLAPEIGVNEVEVEQGIANSPSMEDLGETKEEIGW